MKKLYERCGLQDSALKAHSECEELQNKNSGIGEKEAEVVITKVGGDDIWDGVAV